jgi:hypothetical protein
LIRKEIMKKTIIASLILTVCSMASVKASPYAPVSKEDMQTKYKGCQSVNS